MEEKEICLRIEELENKISRLNAHEFIEKLANEYARNSLIEVNTLLSFDEYSDYYYRACEAFIAGYRSSH